MQLKEIANLFAVIQSGIDKGIRPEDPPDVSAIDRWSLVGKTYTVATPEGRKTIISLGTRRKYPKEILVLLSHRKIGQFPDTNAEIYPNGVIEVFSPGKGLSAVEISKLLQELAGRLPRD